MPAIHEIATLNSKGQVTLPKSVRQLLGLVTGGKVAFDVRGDEVVVSQVETAQEDPAISAFLSLLEADIRSGLNITALPEDLAQTLLAKAGYTRTWMKRLTVRPRFDAATWLDVVVS